MSEFLKDLMKDLEKGNELVFRLTADGISVVTEERTVIGYLTKKDDTEDAASGEETDVNVEAEDDVADGYNADNDDGEADSDSQLTLGELFEMAKAKARTIGVLTALADALVAGECDFLKGAADLSVREMLYLAEEILDAADDQEKKFKDWCSCDFARQMIDGMMESMEFVTEPSDVSESGDGRGEAGVAKNEPSGASKKNSRASFAGASE